MRIEATTFPPARGWFSYGYILTAESDGNVYELAHPTTRAFASSDDEWVVFKRTAETSLDRDTAGASFDTLEEAIDWCLEDVRENGVG